MSERWAWIGDVTIGGLVPIAEALVSVEDAGFMVGDGVFETIRVLDGVPILFDEHITRLRRAAAELGFPVPQREILVMALRELLIANTDAPRSARRLRITLTAGVQEDAHGTLALTLNRHHPLSEPMSMTVSPWRCTRHSSLTGIKSTSYGGYMRAWREARGRGFDEALILDEGGFVVEGSRSNIFARINGVFITPHTALGGLAGVTREAALTWLDAEQGELTLQDLERADALVCSSAMLGLHAVHSMDHLRFENSDISSLCQEFDSAVSQISQSRWAREMNSF